MKSLFTSLSATAIVLDSGLAISDDDLYSQHELSFCCWLSRCARADMHVANTRKHFSDAALNCAGTAYVPYPRMQVAKSLLLTRAIKYVGRRVRVMSN